MKSLEKKKARLVVGGRAMFLAPESMIDLSDDECVDICEKALARAVENVNEDGSLTLRGIRFPPPNSDLVGLEYEIENFSLFYRGGRILMVVYEPVYSVADVEVFKSNGIEYCHAATEYEIINTTDIKTNKLFYGKKISREVVISEHNTIVRDFYHSPLYTGTVN